MADEQSPEKLDPGDDDRGARDHRVKRLEGLLLAEPRDRFDQGLQVGLDRPEIDVLGITSRHQRVVIVCHGMDRARLWLTIGYDEGRWSKAPISAGAGSLFLTHRRIAGAR
jgi:hypothetical protein